MIETYEYWTKKVKTMKPIQKGKLLFYDFGPFYLQYTDDRIIFRAKNHPEPLLCYTHREAGPAMIYKDGSQYYFLDGAQCSEYDLQDKIDTKRAKNVEKIRMKLENL